MIYISDTAQKYFNKLLAKKKKGTQIRIFVNNPGTLNAECGVSYCIPDTVTKEDTALKFNGFIVYVDKLSILFLENAEIDFFEDQLNSQLVLKAPNAKKPNITSEKRSSLIKRVEYFLQFEINPQIANHGGRLSLITITDDNYAILQFGGSCNGCSMVNVTLKEGVEKKLLSEFPILKGIYDITDHKRGKHSYY